MLVVGGIGLYGARDITLGLTEYLKRADKVFLEVYTSVAPSFSEDLIKDMFGVEPVLLTRRDLEERGGEPVLRAAETGLAVFVTLGHPLMATTHRMLVVEARRRGIDVVILPAPSVFDGVVSATGLHVYKFGRIATLVYPQPEYGFYPLSTYEALLDDLRRGLHTLLLLDLKVEEGVYMDVPDAARVLLELEEKAGGGVVRGELLIIGVARATAPDGVVAAVRLREVGEVEWGPPPHSIIIPGLLHESEMEYLSIVWGVEREVLDSWNSIVRNEFMYTRDT